MTTRNVVRLHGYSARFALRPVIVAAILTLLALSCLLGSISLGSTWLNPASVFDVLLGGGNRASRYQVLELRLPRAAIGALAGAALAVAGALLQSTVRNPLASPDVLGITSGASVGAVLVYVLNFRIGGAPLSVSLPLAAVLGAALAALLVFALSRGTDRSGLRLILVGIGVNAGLQGTIYWLLVVGGTFDVQAAQVWLSGDLSADSSRIAPLAVALVATLVAGTALSRHLTSLQLGTDVACGIGVPVRSVFNLSLCCSVVAAALAVSAAGPLGFVAFAAPQLARMLIRATRPPIFGSAACGAVLVLAADALSRTVLNGFVSVGLITAVLGGPMLLALLFDRIRRTS